MKNENETREEVLSILRELNKVGKCDNPEHLVQHFMESFYKGADVEQTLTNLRKELPAQTEKGTLSDKEIMPTADLIELKS